MRAGVIVPTSPVPESAGPTPRCPRPFNIACHLSRLAATVPDRAAVVVTAARDRTGRAVYRSLTFAELEALSNRYANGLAEAGFERGMRVLLMVRPGAEFIALTFALFKMGAAPVMIDPGMGVSRLLECVRTVDLHGFIGIPVAHVMRLIRPAPFRTVKHFVTVGRKWGWVGPTLVEIEQRGGDRYAMAETRSDDTAAILFTSGGTGPAKGVVYQHGLFGAQVEAIRDFYNMQPGEVDLPAFPLFALFSIAMGMTSVIPDMDASRPASVDPVKIVSAILDHRVTTTFGSPAIWSRVASFCVDRGIKLPSLRRILIAGAPVPPAVIEKLHRVLPPGADVHTPYGATEALPVSSISGRELLPGCAERSRRGAGTCVGRPLPGIDLRIIRICDEAIATWREDLVLPNGEIGEIVVSGDVVTEEYFGLSAADVVAKIKDGDRVWHRIGDVGYRDERGCIWFCGRKAHRVTTPQGVMFSVPCEAIFNEHPDVVRSALVGVGTTGRQTPVIIVEPKPGKFPKRSETERFRDELLALGRASDLTRSIEHVLFHRAFPVDVRHNAKIDREALALGAAGRLR